jgi:hypothetical protein
MGILLGFALICIIIYTVLISNGVYLLLKFILIQKIALSITPKLLWVGTNVALYFLSSRFLIAILKDAKGNENMESVWKFYMVLNTLLFLIVTFIGYRSK